MCLELLALHERLVSELASAELALDTARKHREGVERTLVPLVDSQSRMVRELVLLGEADTLIMLESLQREREAKAQLIQARESVSLAAVDVAEIAGPDLLRLSDPAGLKSDADDELLAQARREAGCTCADCVAKAAEAIRARSQPTKEGR